MSKEATSMQQKLRGKGALTLAELLHGVLNSQYASIFPDGIFDLPMQMPDGLPVVSLYVDDGIITVSDDEEAGEF